MNEWKIIEQLLNTVQHKTWSAFYYFPELNVKTLKKEKKIAGLVKTCAQSYRIRPQMVIDKVKFETSALHQF